MRGKTTMPPCHTFENRETNVPVLRLLVQCQKVGMHLDVGPFDAAAL